MLSTYTQLVSLGVARPVEKANRKTSWKFLKHLLKVAPYKIHTIFADNGIQCAEQPRNRGGVAFRKMRFDMICEANGIARRLSEPNRPRTHGRIARMKRTVKDATAKHFYCEDRDPFKRRFSDFIDVYNFGRRLKTLKGLASYGYTCKDLHVSARSIHPKSDPSNDRTEQSPSHAMPRRNQPRGQCGGQPVELTGRDR